MYMASKAPAKSLRANIMWYLIAVDVLMLAVLHFGFGALSLFAIGLGLALILPYTLGTLVGARLFYPEWERAYRRVAYLVIAASALFSLPIWP
ncbi:MAG: hypothetical protein AAGD04_00035 [Pseudomonadota bacterium]